MLESILHIVLVLISFALIGLVLIQQGKGSDVGASFGAGASQTVFGSAGSGNFLTRMTTILGLIFFVICFGLAYWSANHAKPGSKFDFSVPAANAPVSDVPTVDTKAQSAPAGGSDVPAVPAAATEQPSTGEPAKPAEEKTAQ
ncbi:MAG TPA: preprotein translocase subunit SecG [Pseudomonadales bacterium]|nr:preprotein translocase subunit SecG [Pseudomonadales bacterium]